MGQDTEEATKWAAGPKTRLCDQIASLNLHRNFTGGPDEDTRKEFLKIHESLLQNHDLHFPPSKYNPYLQDNTSLIRLYKIPPNITHNRVVVVVVTSLTLGPSPVPHIICSVYDGFMMILWLLKIIIFKTTFRTCCFYLTFITTFNTCLVSFIQSVITEVTPNRFY